MVELMVTVAIVAILAAVALPGFESTMRSNRVATAGNELQTSISLARSEAMRSPGGAAICTSNDGTSCNGTSWDEGWMVWIDMDGDGLPTGVNDRVVRRVEPIRKVAFTATSPGGASAANLIRFDTRGRANNNQVRIGLQSEVCPAGQQLRRVFFLMPTGQTRVEKTACA